MDIQIGDLYSRVGAENLLVLVTNIEYDDATGQSLIFFNRVAKPWDMDLIFSHVDFFDYYEMVK